MVWEDWRGQRAARELRRAPGAVEPVRERARGARRGARGPRRDAAAVAAGDRRGLPRHLQARRDPAVDVGALRRRGDRAPAARLRRAARGHRRGEPRPHPRGPGRAGARDGRRLRAGDGRRLARRTRWSTPPPTTPPSSTTRPAPPGSAKGILHAHRYLLAHEEFEFCHDVRDGELFHGSGEWAWAAGHLPAARARGATARWRSCRRARAATTPRSTCASSSKHGVENMFTTPTALRAMTGVEDAGTRYPLERAAHHLLGRRAAQPRGDPLVPRPVRHHRARLLRAHGELPAVRQLPDGRGARGLDGAADARAGTWRSSTRTSSRCRRASAARSACARARTRTTRSATGTGPRTPRRCSAATGSTRRTRR